MEGRKRTEAEVSIRHIPVLLQESIEGLALQSGDVAIDATVGEGGHARAICEHLGEKGVFIGIDKDRAAIRDARAVLREYPCKRELITGDFRNLRAIAEHAGIRSTDAVLFDLGARTHHFKGSGRGFTFERDEPLIMTFGVPDERMVTAYDIVNRFGEQVLEKILRDFGEERFSRRIARAIVRARRKKPIATTRELVEVVRGCVPASYRNRKTHYATKTFQALRIAVNDEFNAIQEGVEAAMGLLAPGGRIAVITFHSIEDRIIKELFLMHRHGGAMRIVTKKPITPSRAERMKNPRSRSAKLRIIEARNHDHNRT